MDAKDNNEVINKMLGMEYIPSVNNEKINIEQYTKFPLYPLATLGIGFSTLSESTRTIAYTVNNDGLYKNILIIILKILKAYL